MRRLAAMIAIGACACLGGEHRDARDKYNEGVAALVKGDDEAAEKALVEACSTAGVDPELRFDAAYDLGIAYAAHAEKTKAGKDADFAKALEQERQAVEWFSDALRLRKDDADTIANLAIVRARAQALSDELDKGAGKLEARLDAVIRDQRGVLDDARTAWLAIRAAGGADPLAQQAALTRLADRERGVVAEVGTIGDLASDEIDKIGKKKEAERDQQEQVRMIQLKNLDLYLLESRARIAEARRKLQELAAEDGLGRAEAALVALKRAREQLLDPVAVLSEVAQDELAMYEESSHAAPQAAAPLLGSAGSASEAEAPTRPAWLSDTALAERQNGLRDRLEEVRARLAAAVDGADRAAAAAAGAANGSGSGAPALKPPTPEQQKLLDKVRAALPAVTDASAAMDRARLAFSGAKLADALSAQLEALAALARAIEAFADLKKAIEIAYQQQQETLALLSPEAAKQLPAAERARKTTDDVDANVARMARIEGLIGEEKAKLAAEQAQIDAKAAQAQAAQAGSAAAGSAAAGSGAPDVGAQVAAAKAQLAQAGKQLDAAEQLRGEAQAALGELQTALAKGGDPLAPAHTADEKLDELRKLFFSVIEHLQELIREQGETRDQVSAAMPDDDATRAPKLPGLITRQDGHAAMAKAIAEALAKQADEATKAAANKPPGAQVQAPQQGPDPKALAGAADEVRHAQTDMSDVHNALGKARDAKNQSVSLQPAVDSQAKAIEHLEAALKLLQPPQKNKDDQQKQDQQQQQQQQQQQKQKQDQQPQPQPQGGAGQRARDEDARRQREKRQGSASDEVEQDW